jgi:hypothetical protein
MVCRLRLSDRAPAAGLEAAPNVNSRKTAGNSRRVRPSITLRELT